MNNITIKIDKLSTFDVQTRYGKKTNVAIEFLHDGKALKATSFYNESLKDLKSGDTVNINIIENDKYLNFELVEQKPEEKLGELLEVKEISFEGVTESLNEIIVQMKETNRKPFLLELSNLLKDLI